MYLHRLVGRPPFVDKNPIALAGKIRQGNIELPSSLSAEAKAFIQQLLNVDPSKRPTAEAALNLAWIKQVWKKNGKPVSHLFFF